MTDFTIISSEAVRSSSLWSFELKPKCWLVWREKGVKPDHCNSLYRQFKWVPCHLDSDALVTPSFFPWPLPGYASAYPRASQMDVWMERGYGLLVGGMSDGMGALQKRIDTSVAPAHEWFHFLWLRKPGIMHGCTGETTRPEPPLSSLCEWQPEGVLGKVGKNPWSNSLPSSLRKLAPRPWPHWYRQFKGTSHHFMACLVVCLLRKISMLCSFFHREALLHHPSCRFPRAEL